MTLHEETAPCCPILLSTSVLPSPQLHSQVVCCSIVFANKTVLTVLNFRFVYALTLVHVLTTLVGLRIFAALGFFERKPLPVRPLLSLAAAFVGYIVFWNVSLQVTSAAPETQ